MLGCHGRGRGFESGRARHSFKRLQGIGNFALRSNFVQRLSLVEQVCSFANLLFGIPPARKIQRNWNRSKDEPKG
jgi:hypothetical protein